HRGPVDGVKPDDTFSQGMNPAWIIGPIAVIELSALLVIQRTDVVDQRVEPYIDHLGGIVWHRNTPAPGALAGPRDAEVLQASGYEAQYLVLPSLRNHQEAI